MKLLASTLAWGLMFITLPALAVPLPTPREVKNLETEFANNSSWEGMDGQNFTVFFEPDGTLQYFNNGEADRNEI